jgi:hypothetical protein
MYYAHTRDALEGMGGNELRRTVKIGTNGQDPARLNGGGPRAAGGSSNSHDEIADYMMAGLRKSMVVNLGVRVGLGIVGLAAAASALAYTWAHAHELVAPVAGRDYSLAEVFARTTPFVLFVLLGLFAAMAAYTAHARFLDEAGRTLETVNRIRREGEVAVSARGLIFAFEEKLTNARRAFTLQLWLGRTLFLVGLGLLVVTVINAMIHGDALLTGAAGAGSFATALLGVTRHVPQNVGQQLADVIQIQSIITGCDRQISLLESAAFAALKDAVPGGAGQTFALEAQSRIDDVVEHAVRQIEEFTEPHRRSGA